MNKRSITFFRLLAILIFFSCVNTSILAQNPVVVKDSDNLIPISGLDKQSITIVSVGASKDNDFATYCTRYFPAKCFGLTQPTASITKIEEASNQSTTIILGVFSAEKWVVEKCRQLYREGKTIMVFFIPDKSISKFAEINPRAIIACQSNSTKNMIAGAEATFGGIEITATLSKKIPGITNAGAGKRIAKTRLGFATPQQEGFSARLESRIDSIVRLNIRKGSFPGCQIVVVKDGNVVIDKAYGRLSTEPGAAKVNLNTIYDIASMTKATATIAGLMKAYDNGLYNLDAPAARYLPRLRGGDKSDITVRQLMHHESGMPATINTYALMVDSTSFTGKLMRYKRTAPYTIEIDKGVWGNNKARLRSDVIHRSPSKGFETEFAKGLYGGEAMRQLISDEIYGQTPGNKKYLYSCLNFCILKDMEETLTGKPHAQWVADEIFRPIGAMSMQFNPAANGKENNIASTERDNWMRRQLLTGYVHDEIAAYSGGIQGNAGLFSNAIDIAKLCQTWLNGGIYGDVQVFSRPTVKLFTEEKSPTVDRGLGFDRASRLKSMADIGLPTSTFGHTGFTGTCFWVDSENKIIVVILCNRVNPSRNNPAFTKFAPRTEILKAVYKSLK